MEGDSTVDSAMEEEKSQSCADEKSTDINAVNENGETQLHIASEEGNLDQVITLLNNGANVHATNKHGSVPLHVAVRRGYLEIVKVLVERGTDINVTNTRGYVPLDMAAWYNQQEIAKFLIEHGAVVTKDQHGYCPSLEYAVNSRNFEVAKILIDNGANVNAIIPHAHYARMTNGTLLHSAARHADTDIMRFLIENGANVNATENDGRTPLTLLLKHDGTYDQIKYLLDHGTDPNNKRGGSALYWVGYSWYGRPCNTEIIKLLIEKGADVNLGDEYGHTPLHIARGLAFTKLLVENGADVNGRNLYGQTRLHTAEKLSIVKYLVQNGATVHALDSEECTPLHYASTVSIAEFLVENGANVNATNMKQYTPLHHARNVAIAEFLIEKGADLNALGRHERTVLHGIAELDTLCDSRYTGVPDIVDLFLNMGIDVNVTDENGNTPLHVCNESSNIYVANKLITRGADLNALNKNNQTPKDGSPGIVTNLICNIKKLFSAVQNNSDFHLIKKTLMLNQVYNAVHDPDKMTLLHYAVQKCGTGTVKHLLNRYGNYQPLHPYFPNTFVINARDVNNWTPLHYAAERGCKLKLSILLNHGAIYNAKTVKGLTPQEISTNDEVTELLNLVDQLFKSVKDGDYDQVLRYITQNNEIINATDENGNTLLYWAVEKGYMNILQLLLKKRANIAIVNNENLTVIHAAVIKENQEILEVLLDDIEKRKNIDNFINWKITSSGDTALHIAARHGSLQIVKSLLSQHAIYNEKNKEYKTPCDLSVNQDVTNFLKTVQHFFDAAVDDSPDIVEELKIMELNDFRAIMNTWNRERQTLTDTANSNTLWTLESSLSNIKSSRLPKLPKNPRNKSKNMYAEEDSDCDIDLGFGLFD